QLDADSLDGRAPRRVEGTALHLLREGLAHIIASDGHWAVQRPPLMSGARGRVARLMGQKAAEEVTRALPRKILRLAVNRASGP
ncbi:MAG: CpsB/CapC family capsule biosynthesis tyrosine phosphatase, partial [Armatimonadota bacterium]